MKNWGEILKEYRLMKGYPQWQMADMLGITRFQISNVENGRSNLGSEPTLRLTHMIVRDRAQKVYEININKDVCRTDNEEEADETSETTETTEQRSETTSFTINMADLIGS